MENRYARYAEQPLQEERPFDFHTSNIQRARTKRLARRIVRLGNLILRPLEGRSLRDVSSVNGTQKQNAFSGATALFRSPASLFCILFSDKPEKSMPPEAFRTGWCRKMSRRRHPAPFRRKKKGDLNEGKNPLLIKGSAGRAFRRGAEPDARRIPCSRLEGHRAAPP